MDLQKKHPKTPCFLPRVSNRSMVSTRPPWRKPTTTGTDGTSPKTAFTAASPAAATALGPVMTSAQPASGSCTKPGGKKSIQWMAVFTYFFYFEEIFFKPAIFFSVAGILVMSCYVRSWSREMNHHPRLPCLRTQISRKLSSESRPDTPGILKSIARLRRWSLWIIPSTMPVNH